MDGAFPIPVDEKERLSALRRYRILDTEREATFDSIAEMARGMFGAERGHISFVDADRVWFKSLARRVQLPRHLSFCTHTIMSNEVLVVPDAPKDARFRDNPAVKELGTRFYAGAPLVTRDGFRIGTLNVTDIKPHRNFLAEEQNRLRILARLVVNELDLRRELETRIDTERDLELVNKMMVAIAEASTAREAIDTSMRLLATAVNAAYAGVFGVVSHSETIQLIGAYGSTPFWRKEIDRISGMTVNLADSLTGVAIQRNEPVISDLREAAKRFPQLNSEIIDDSRTSITIPLHQNGQNFALHFFFEARPPKVTLLAKRIAELAEKVRPALVRKFSEDRIELLQSIVLHANDAAMVLMPDSATDPKSRLHVAYINPAMSRMTGFEFDELLGKPASILWGDNRNGPVPLDTLEGVAPWRRELQFRRKNGTHFWADINAVPVDNEITGKRHVIAVVRDTTERRRLEQALREREETFHLLFSSAPVPMMLLDVRTQRYIEVNDHAVRLFGYTHEQFLAMSAEAIRSPDEIERYKAVLKMPVPDSGRRGMWRYVKADGSELVVDVTVHPFRFQDRPMAIIATVDVTDQKRAEAQIRHARDLAEAASRAKTDLLANMSHELRTPLNAIIGFSQIMREQLFGPLGASRYHGYVGDILESAHHLLAVINDILDLAKIEANSFHLREGLVEPEGIVSAALRLVRPRADQAGIALKVQDDAPGVMINGDETALKRVLVNLLANAVKFSEAGTSVTVRTTLNAQNEFAIAVEDRGIGMAPEEIPVALTPFQQVDIGLRRKYEGTGLGLPIAKQLVELHGGELMIESARGQGTTVTVLLPAKRITVMPSALLMARVAAAS